jgi:hypothetical protein
MSIGTVMTGPLQHEIHEAGAPQAGTSGGIAAEIAASFGDDARSAADVAILRSIRAGYQAGLTALETARSHRGHAAFGSARHAHSDDHDGHVGASW